MNANKRKKMAERDRESSLMGVVMEQGKRFPLEFLDSWVGIPNFGYLKSPVRAGINREVSDSEWSRMVTEFMSCSECRAPMTEGQKTMAIPYWESDVTRCEWARNYCRRCTVRLFDKTKAWFYGDK